MTETCTVCGEPLDTEHQSRCRFCGGSFHMAWSTDAPVKSCGHVIFDQRSCGVMFVCANCVEQYPEIRSSIVGAEQPPESCC